MNERRLNHARLAIRHPVGCALIIPMIIQTILLKPSGAVWTDEAPNVSSLDPSGAIQIDAKHPTRNRKVVGSNPTSGSKTAGQGPSGKASIFRWIRRWQPEHMNSGR
jgi:hypothetical protein